MVVVTRLDRLARTTRDFSTSRGFSRRASASSRAGAASIRPRTGRLVLTSWRDCEFERELITPAWTEGRKRAVAKGVKFGPKFKLSHFQKQEALTRLAAGERRRTLPEPTGCPRPPSAGCRRERRRASGTGQRKEEEDR